MTNETLLPLLLPPLLLGFDKTHTPTLPACLSATLFHARGKRCLVIGQAGDEQHVEEAKGNVDTELFTGVTERCQHYASQLPTLSPPQPLFPAQSRAQACMKHTAHQTDDRPSDDGYWPQGCPFSWSRPARCTSCWLGEAKLAGASSVLMLNTTWPEFERPIYRTILGSKVQSDRRQAAPSTTMPIIILTNVVAQLMASG
ncbi:hypothetical protein PG997_009418 [Apiospora hydei]|uniref:Uncharacterized protein n=1 Tax=Apiospora hydei TaxID=1337664 RepID=A0ABR1VU20_9PEZI